MRIPLAHFSILAAAVMLGGCAFSPHLAKRMTPRDLEPFVHHDELEWMDYMGSDSKYHYFCNHDFIYTSSYKIPVSELPLEHTYPLRRKPYDWHAAQDIFLKLRQTDSQ